MGPVTRSYLTFREKLGYTSYTSPRITHQAKAWDDYVVLRKIKSVRQVDERFILDWIHSHVHNSPKTKNHRLWYVRGLFKYLIRLGLATHNPTKRIRDLKTLPHRPYLFTLKEIQQLLEQARGHTCRRSACFLGPTMYTVIFLLYACGLRLGEALNLKIQDVDFEENTLSLWKTKFHKERLIPFSKVTAGKLKAFLALRRKRFPPAAGGDPFFCHRRGKVTGKTIRFHFRPFLVRCGLAHPKGRGGPRPHDLRHAFAVHRLYKWYQQGHDILNKLPLLSTYMGHVDIEKTQVYLTVTQALLREGDRRFQTRFEDLVIHRLKRARRRTSRRQ